MWWNSRTDRFNAGFSLVNGQLVYHRPQKINPVPLYQHSMTYRYLDSNYLFGKGFTFLLDRLSFEIWGQNSNVWQVTQKILDEMKKLADKQGYPFIVVDIPVHSQLANAGKSRTRQQLLRRTSESLGIDYYDLLSAYPQDYRSLFVRGDSHWSEKGHRFIADFLVPILRQHLI